MATVPSLQHDPYPEYAHLYWYTTDLTEFGKYSELRSKDQFGPHVMKEDEHFKYYPGSYELGALNYEQRNVLYATYMRYYTEWENFLHDEKDAASGETYKHMMEDLWYGTIAPAQAEAAKGVAQKVIESCKSMGIPYTKKSAMERVKVYLKESLDHHQIHDMKQHIEPVIEEFGHGPCMNAE